MLPWKERNSNKSKNLKVQQVLYNYHFKCDGAQLWDTSDADDDFKLK